MSRINILDENTANKIAAGEVVERPSSIVKELVENSIDANAKNISIEFEEGGINLIRIIDDGNGVFSEDLEKAFLPHATSKIGKVEDIYNINTLGFRGEALPSIASVSKVLFKSRQKDVAYGREINIEGGKRINLEDVGMNEGTFIEVREIFFNVPARKKFLKSITRESSIINDIVTRIALSNPDVSFKLMNNNKKVLHTIGNGNLKDVIRTIYGKTVYENIIYFSGSFEDVHVSGYIGNEEIAKGSRNNQSIFVNKRYIKNKTIIAAAENAFKSFSALNKFPFCVIFLDVPTEFVDVNIHPTKAEIKFKDERMIFKVVFDAIHKALRSTMSNVFLDNEKVIEEEDIVEEISFNISPQENKVNTNPIVEIEVEKREVNLNSVYNSITAQDIKKEEELYNSLRKINVRDDSSDLKPKYAEVKDDIYNTNDDNKATKSSVEETITHTAEIKEQNEEEQYVENEAIAKFPMLRIIGQFNKTYILAEYLQDLYIIDQHAAHEKILFEKYYNQIKEQSIIVQPLLVPAVIDLSLDDYSYYEENENTFNNAGFVIEHFGGNTIAIKEVPYFLGRLNAKNLFYDILSNLKKLGSGNTIDVKLNSIASMACKSAVKANDYLNIIEMEKLINDLRYIEDPFHCPHGRPIIIKFTDYELNKKFRRII